MRMVANNMKRGSMAGSYACAEDDGKSSKLNGFLRFKILKSNLLITVANRTCNPNLGLLTQEVSRFYNGQHIGTIMMQSFIFPSKIVGEMD